jgi:hypothetical protein
LSGVRTSKLAFATSTWQSCLTQRHIFLLIFRSHVLHD